MFKQTANDKSTDSHRFAKWYLYIALSVTLFCMESAWAAEASPDVAVLLVDTDRVMGRIHENIYGHFLEHINHSVVDGLFAEQIRGRGFEGRDFQTYWKTLSEHGRVELVNEACPNGERCVRITVNSETAGIQQGRVNLSQGQVYNGSVWLKPEQGQVTVHLLVKGSDGKELNNVTLAMQGTQWQEVAYAFSASKSDTQASIEIVAKGSGSVLVDYVSMMREDCRSNGMLRPDLMQALQDLKPPFIRWPGGSFASLYRWKDGIGPHVKRTYHPNQIWGGYSDYYGFGTEEFMAFCSQLGTEPMIVLPATDTDEASVQYAMDWVHYLLDPPTTQWGRLRAQNGHTEPYEVPYIQIDNEPMNHGLSPDQYAEIVNVYGSRLREIAPNARIVACGQKRSSDMIWSQKLIDIAGDNFDILGCHNYEYEPENFQTGIQRIQDYLVKLRDYVRISKHPDIKIAVLEWNLSRTYDWRAGLHAAGSLIAYEKLGPELDMTCPALLMRNTSDDPTWTAFIYHDHVSWFPGSGYVVEKLFRDHYAPVYYAASAGTSRDMDQRSQFFDRISETKPVDWTPGTVDAIATGSEDGKRIVIKAVNYQDKPNVLLTRLQGSTLPKQAHAQVYSISADLNDAASLDNPDKLDPVQKSMPYTNDMAIKLEPYSVVVLEITAE